MSLADLLHRRRAVRHYEAQPLDTDTVTGCLELAHLAPSSSNLQLYEFYHVTDPATLRELAHACLDQRTATTAAQMVVFVTRQDLHRDHAHKVLEFEKGNITRNSPPDRQAHRIARQTTYYMKLMPFLYSRAFGLLGILRRVVTEVAHWFRPMITNVTEADMRTVAHKSCGLAAQTFMLAMAEAGYDTCPLEGFDEGRVKKILGLPRAARITMVITCGIRRPDRGVWGERFRLPFSEIYHRR